MLATTNPAKQEKLRWLLDGLGLSFLTPADLSPMAPVPEEGKTHRENAEAKAIAWSLHARGLAIATDGGLVIPALGDRWDALRTGRSAGAGATDRDRLDQLLELMRPYIGTGRAAHWTEAVALAGDGRPLASWEAESRPGFLAESYDSASIKPGFWAFSLWYLPEIGKPHSLLTPAEIERAEDHWGRLRAHVRDWFARRAGGLPLTGTP